MNQQILERAHYVPSSVPIDTTGAARAGDWINMTKYRRILFIIQQGAWAGGTPALTFQQATSNAGGSAKALGYTKKYTGTALTADTLTEVAVVSDTSNLTNGANHFTLVEFHVNDLDRANGFYYIQCNVASPGSNADLISIGAILMDGNVDAAPTRMQTAIV